MAATSSAVSSSAPRPWTADRSCRRSPKLNNLPHSGSGYSAVSGLPSSNRGVNRSGENVLAAGCWSGIDWVAGSVDLFELLHEDGTLTPCEALGAHLAAYGPKPKPKTPEADKDGQLIVGRAAPFVPADDVVQQIARIAFDYLFEGTGLCLSIDANPGKFYAYRFMIRNVFDEPAGMIELGGSMTLRKGGNPSLRFELTGLGCGVLEGRGDASADHAQPWCAFRAKLERVSPLLSRIDVAFDDFAGERSLAVAKCMYDVGEFDYSFGGERLRPQARSMDDHGSGAGSTFYVGNSSSEKQLRVYEKGRQLGDPESPWVRWEMQMRGSTRKRLSLDVLTDPTAYMRGAYECLDFVSSCMKRLAVTKEATKATLKSVIRHSKRMYGKFFSHMHVLAPNPESVIELMDALRTEGVPRYLKRGRLCWEDVLAVIRIPDHQQEN